MFQDLIRAFEGIGGRKISVAMSVDVEGYFDRACPSDACLYEFKIHGNDWKENLRGEQVFCPLCRHSASSDEWWTDTQIEHVHQAALNGLRSDINQAVKRDADRWNRCQPRDSFIRMTISVENSPRHVALPPAAAEPMKMKVTCPACECRYAVIGAAYFCPACGHNSVERDFKRSIQIQFSFLDVITYIRQAVGDRDIAENMVRKIAESGLLNAVAAFQRYAEALYWHKPDVPEPRRNVFQNLSAGSDLWQQVYGYNFEHYLGADKLADLNRYFQQRHLLAHKDGLVDAGYIQRSGDTSYKEGQRIVVKEESVHKCLALVERLACGLEADALDGTTNDE